jgi:sec-independent protein translocase protein TatA
MTSLSALALIGPIGMPELLVLLFIVVLLFGAKKLPELARGLGKARSEFQKASHEVEKEASGKDTTNGESKTPPAGDK